MKKLKLILLAWLPIFAWMIYAHLHGGGYTDAFMWVNPYNHELGQVNFLRIWQRIFANGMNTPLILTEIFNYVFASIFVFFMFVGIGQVWHDRKYRVLLLYMGIFLVITWSLPSVWLAGRYYLPLLPVFCIFAVKGIETMRRNVREKLILAFVVVSLIGVFSQTNRVWRENVAYLKNREYPKRKEYTYYRLHQAALRNGKIIVDENRKIVKPEVFLWIKKQEIQK